MKIRKNQKKDYGKRHGRNAITAKFRSPRHCHRLVGKCALQNIFSQQPTVFEIFFCYYCN
jgi:hypothetical protein